MKNYKEVDVKTPFFYKNVEFDDRGWADANKFRPSKYDLVLLKILREQLDFSHPLVGWWTGNTWDGFKIRPNDEVIAWKKTGDHQYVHH